MACKTINYGVIMSDIKKGNIQLRKGKIMLVILRDDDCLIYTYCAGKMSRHLIVVAKLNLIMPMLAGKMAGQVIHDCT